MSDIKKVSDKVQKNMDNFFNKGSFKKNESQGIWLWSKEDYEKIKKIEESNFEQLWEMRNYTNPFRMSAAENEHLVRKGVMNVSIIRGTSGWDGDVPFYTWKSFHDAARDYKKETEEFKNVEINDPSKWESVTFELPTRPESLK